MGYPTHEENVEILKRKLTAFDGTDTVVAVNREDVLAAREELARVYVHEDVLGYAADICEATRYGKDVLLGASPRAMIALVRVSMGYAAMEGRDFVLPDDVKRSAVPVLAHRILFENSFLAKGDRGRELVEKILETVTVPSEDIRFSR